MKTVRLVHGTDILDLTAQFGDATYKLPDGRAVPKFVFHALDANSVGVDPALRGRAVEVTDAQAEELLTLPAYTFEEVDEATAEADRYRRTLVRDGFGRLLDPTTGQVVGDGTPRGAIALPSAPPVALSQVRPSDAIVAEVAAELAAAPIEDAPTDGGGRKKAKD